MSDDFSNKSDKQIIQSIIPALAMSSSELRTARADLSKAIDRVSFSLGLVNELLDRHYDDSK